MAFCAVCDSESAFAFCASCGSATKDKPRDIAFFVAGSRVYVPQILAAVLSISLLIFLFARPNSNWGLRLLASTILVGLSIAVARYPRTVIYSRGISVWIRKRIAAASAGGWLSRWLLRPALGLLDVATKVTAVIPDPFLQAGCRFVIWIVVTLAAILTLFYVGMIIAVIVFAIVAICIGLWLLSVIFAILNDEKPKWPTAPRFLPPFAQDVPEYTLDTKADGTKHLMRDGVFEESVGPLYKTGSDTLESRNILAQNIQLKENSNLLGRDRDRPFEVLSDGKAIGHFTPAEDLFGSKADGKYTFEPHEDKEEG